MTRNFRILLVIVLFAIAASFLSACDGNIANAFSAGPAPAYGNNVNMSPRLDNCSHSDRQLILNAVNADKDYYSKFTVDAVLDSFMSAYTCIAPKP